MARTAITPTAITRDGVTPGSGTAGDVANGNSVTGNDGEKLFIVVENSGASSRTCTFVTSATVGDIAIEDQEETIAAGVTMWFGPFSRSLFGGAVGVDPEHADLLLSAYRL